MKVVTKIEELSFLPIGQKFVLSRYLLVQLKPNWLNDFMKEKFAEDYDVVLTESILRQGIEVIIRPRIAHHITDNKIKGSQR